MEISFKTLLKNKSRQKWKIPKKHLRIKSSIRLKIFQIFTVLP